MAATPSHDPPREVTIEALTASSVESKQSLYGPPGRFLSGRYGITHFHLELPTKAVPAQRTKIAVLSHGLGTNSNIYKVSLAEALLSEGFRVLRYDFLDHGWSQAREPYPVIDKEVLVAQASELLDHVLAPGEPVDLWVGHSTGGLVGMVMALETAARHPLLALALLAPAAWVKKPLTARLFDKIPETVFGLYKRFSFLKNITEDGYLENNDSAFAKRGSAYLYPIEHQAGAERIKRQYQLHPESVTAIASIANFFLREDLFVPIRQAFKSLMEQDDSTAVPRVCLLWGKYDIVVPFQHAQELVSWAKTPGRVTLMELEAGHEAVWEIPRELAAALVRFVRQQSKL